MEALDLDAHVLANRRGVAFTLMRGNSTVECVVALAALEAHFWLEPLASDERILKTFRDGYNRIRALAERKMLAQPSSHIALQADDFAQR
jgi:hypothetical protein